MTTLAMTERKLLSIASRMMNLEKQELVDRGIIPTGDGGHAWKGFNSDPLTFIVKLGPKKRNELLQLMRD